MPRLTGEDDTLGGGYDAAHAAWYYDNPIAAWCGMQHFDACSANGKCTCTCKHQLVLNANWLVWRETNLKSITCKALSDALHHISKASIHNAVANNMTYGWQHNGKRRSNDSGTSTCSIHSSCKNIWSKHSSHKKMECNHNSNSSHECSCTWTNQQQTTYYQL